MALGAYDIRFILSVTDRTGNSLRRFAGDLRGATADAKRMQKAFVAMDVGRGLQLRGLLAGAGLGAAAQQAATFSTLVTKAATQAANSKSIQDVGKNTILLEQEILDLMAQFPGSAQQQADAAYDIFSAMNVPLQKGVGLLKLFNMVAVAGATDIETATNAMITVFNTFGGTFEENMRAVETSFGIIHYGRIEFGEFATMLGSVVPAAKGAGQSLEDVAGAMAFLTTRMGPGLAATGLSRMLEVISRPDFRKGARLLGLEFEDMNRQLKPFPELIKELARLPVAKVEGAIGQLIPLVTAVGRGGGRGIQSNVMARRALVALVKDEKGYQQIQKLTLAATGEFEKRYVAMIGSAGVQWEKFKATLQAVVITVGTIALPWFTRLGEIVSRGIDWVKANKGMIEFTVKAVAIAAAASLLVGTFAKLYASALILITVMGRLGKMFGFAAMVTRVTAAIGFLGAAFSLLAAHGLKALPVIFMNAKALSTIAKLGVITTAVIVIWQVHKTKGWNEFWKTVDERILSGAKFIKKGGAAGELIAAPIEALIGLDKKVRIKNLADIKAAKTKGKGNNKELAKEYENNFKQLIADIKKSVGNLGADLFNKKMMKDLGLDPAAIQNAIDALLNPDTNKAKADAAANAKRIAQEITDRTKELLKQASDGLMQVYNEFKSTNESAFGSIFEPIEGEGEEAQLRKAWNWTGGANNLLNTMKARLAQFTKWRGMLSKLLKKGFSKDFVEEFRQMGPEGLKHFDELMTAGPRKVKQFNTVMAKGKGAIVKATEIDFNAQLKKWEAFGKNTAFKIAAGLMSAEPELERRMVAAVDRMWGGVAEAIARNEVLVAEAARKAAEAAAGGLVVPDILKATPKPTGKGRVYPAPTAAGIAAAGTGPYAIPSSATGGLTVAAVTAMGARYNAMAEAYGIGKNRPPGWIPPGAFQNTSYTVNVNGTFMSEAEMMNAALRQTGHKVKNKR